jgi:hypothetical protein
MCVSFSTCKEDGAVDIRLDLLSFSFFLCIYALPHSMLLSIHLYCSGIPWCVHPACFWHLSPKWWENKLPCPRPNQWCDGHPWKCPLLDVHVIFSGLNTGQWSYLDIGTTGSILLRPLMWTSRKTLHGPSMKDPSSPHPPQPSAVSCLLMFANLIKW